MIRLFTDSDTDMTPEECAKYGYTLISMPYAIDGQITYPYRDFKEFKSKEFYDLLRQGTLPTTCALNPEEYKAYFEPVFAAGDDILYVHFSAAMSGTFNSMNLALMDLQEQYPERKVYTIDTKGITILSYNICKEIGDLYLEGKTVEEILEWAAAETEKFCCYFFADDLKFFKKSGRVSGIAATMGSIFAIKPIIYIGSDGKMVSIGKARGRKNAIQKLYDYVEELKDDFENHRVIIGHTDCIELAEELGKILEEKYGKLNIEYVVINPTAGSHSGPDCVGISFHCIHR